MITPKSTEKMSLRKSSSIDVTRLASPEKSLNFKTVTLSLLERLRSSRNKLIDGISNDGFQEHFADELSVKACKDSIRLSLIENMKRSGWNVNCLFDIENRKIFSEHITEKYQSLNSEEKNLVFLWSTFVKRDDLLESLYQIGADFSSTLPNEGFSALHLAAFSGCVKSCEWLILNGLHLNAVAKRLSPLHCAVLGNSLDCTKMLLQHGSLLDNAVLHRAVEANATDCLRYLLRENNEINVTDEFGLTALHVAADRGLATCLEIIISHRSDVDLNCRTRGRKSTPLHLASENGYFECCRLLINGGADVNAVNYKGQSALHLAAKMQDTDCMELLLDAGCNANGQDVDGRTPLHSAMAKPLLAFDALTVLLKRNVDVNVGDYYGYTPLHLAALNELPQCVDNLIMIGADVTAHTNGGLSALGSIGRKTPGSIKTICRKLDSSVSVKDHATMTRGVALKLDFRYILQNASAGEVGFLKTLKAEGQKHLLEHPLCQAFLHLKWQKIRKFYFCRLFMCLVFVILLTVYVISALAHECYNAARNISVSARETCLNNSAVVNKYTVGSFLVENPGFIESIWYVLAFIAILETIRKIMGIAGCKSIKRYFFRIGNAFEWFVILSVFSTSCVWQRRIFEWQKHNGALAILLAWTNFMILIGQLPLFGTYVAMYTRVQAEFFKLLLAYLCLLVGFTASFCVVLPSEKTFQNPLIGFIKVLTMMTGEMDFSTLEDDLKAEATLLLNFSAHIIFLLFLLFVTVVLMNLLVGIAVHDIQGLHKTAGLSKLVQQTELIYFLELAICNGYVPKRMVQFLRQLALVSPQAYRVVLYVKPLNPRENRLPKSVLRAAFKLAKQRKSWRNSTCCWSDTLQDGTDDTTYHDGESLYEEVRQLKEMVRAQNALISKLMDNKCSNSS